MPLKSALRWSLYDRMLALFPFLIGAAIAAAGVWVGAGAFLDELAFGDPSNAGDPASVPIVIVGLALGVIVWQIGRSAVRHHTTRRAMSNQVDEHVDDERIASNAASKVDGRISDVENDVEQLSRKVTRIEQQVRGDQFAAEELEPDYTSAGEPSADADASAADADAGTADASDGNDRGVAATGDGPKPDDDRAADAVGGDAATDDAAADADAEKSGGTVTDEPTATAADASAAEEANTDDANDGDDEAADDEGDGGFEWENDDSDGEYYRNS